MSSELACPTPRGLSSFWLFIHPPTPTSPAFDPRSPHFIFSLVLPRTQLNSLPLPLLPSVLPLSLYSSDNMASCIFCKIIKGIPLPASRLLPLYYYS